MAAETYPQNLLQGETPLNLGKKTEDEVLTNPEDLEKKNYIKISPTFYVQLAELEEGKEKSEDEEAGEELYKVLNPETGVAVKRKLTDEEQHEIFVKNIKEQQIKFRNVTHKGNVTSIKFNSEYKKKRQRRNKLAKQARQRNRK